MCICLIEARLRNHFCLGKVINITCCDYVFVALVIKHEKRMRLIAFQENPSSFNRVVACGQTEGRTDGPTDRRTDGPTDRRTDR